MDLFDKGTKDVSFQRHVLTGFAKVKNPKYNVDIDRLVATYGHRIIAGHDVEEGDFLAVGEGRGVEGVIGGREAARDATITDVVRDVCAARRGEHDSSGVVTLFTVP